MSRHGWHCCLLVLPNYAFVLYDLPYWCAQTWSIGVEEQFYYLWPWIIKYPKKSGRIVFLFLVVTAVLLIRRYLSSWIKQMKRKCTAITTFLGQFRIQTMALGGLCAYLVYNQKTRILDFVFRKDVQIVVYTFVGHSVFFRHSFYWISGIVRALFQLFCAECFL